MPLTMTSRLPRVGFAALILSGALVADSTAKEGDPVALIRTQSGNLRIETMSGLSVEIAKMSGDSGRQRSHAKIVRNTKDGVADDPCDVTLALTQTAEVDHVWDRKANSENPRLEPVTRSSEPSPHAIRIQAADQLISLRVDGLQIAFVGNAKLNAAAMKKLSGCDALVINVPGGPLQRALSMARQCNAQRLIVNADAEIDGAIKNIGNTLAVSALDDGVSGDTIQIIQLSNVPVQLPKELTRLFDAKEVACKASQAVFAPLSVQQMNFQPENGSHTPRWNAEHMMGRELLFFSQIYHAMDPSIPVMDLNPKQMPPDYRARHLDWTGAEEAWQMQRVTAFTRRFAHLLVDLPLDEKAPGSRWTPRGLMKQMERHYGEHTANVKLKFKLPGWPAK